MFKICSTHIYVTQAVHYYTLEIPSYHIPKTSKTTTYPSPRFIVVQVHLLPEISSSFTGIHKLPAELEAEADVVRTSAPVHLPYSCHRVVARHLRATPMVAVVAVAGLYGPLAARPGNGVRHCRTGYCVDKRCLSTT